MKHPESEIGDILTLYGLTVSSLGVGDKRHIYVLSVLALTFNLLFTSTLVCSQ